MLYFVDRVGLVACALEFLGRLGLGIKLSLGFVFGCMSPVDMICKCVCNAVDTTLFHHFWWKKNQSSWNACNYCNVLHVIIAHETTA